MDYSKRVKPLHFSWAKITTKFSKSSRTCCNCFAWDVQIIWMTFGLCRWENVLFFVVRRKWKSASLKINVREKRFSWIGHRQCLRYFTLLCFHVDDTYILNWICIHVMVYTILSTVTNSLDKHNFYWLKCCPLMLCCKTSSGECFGKFSGAGAQLWNKLHTISLWVYGIYDTCLCKSLWTYAFRREVSHNIDSVGAARQIRK